jgi:hypothetical protein
MTEIFCVLQQYTFQNQSTKCVPIHIFFNPLSLSQYTYSLNPQNPSLHLLVLNHVYLALN